MMKNKFISYLNFFVGIGALVFLLSLFLVFGFKNGFGGSFKIIFSALPLCGITYLVLYLCAWVHYRLLSVFLGKAVTERQLNTVRVGTLAFVGVVEVLLLLSLLQMNSTYSIIILFIPPLALVSLFIVFWIAKILGLRSSPTGRLL